MTVVTRSVNTTHLASLASLEALAAIAGIPISCAQQEICKGGDDDDDDENSFALEMTVTSHNAFNAVRSSYTARGLTGCARVICRAVPESGLWGDLGGGGGRGDGGLIDCGLVESWIETAADCLIGPAYIAGDARVKDPQFKSQVESFAKNIEDHLFNTSNTFLVGDMATAADVVVSILLADAASRTGVAKIPEQTYRLLSTILQNPTIVKTVGKVDIPLVGDASPTEKKSTKKEEVAKTEKEATPKKDTLPDKVKAPKKEKKVQAQASAPKNQVPKKEEPPLPDLKDEEPVEVTPTPTSTPTPQTSTQGDFASNAIVQKLDSLSIPHTTYSHKLSETVDDLLKNVPLPSNETHTKNLFFKDKKHGLFLVSVKADSDVNTKQLGKALKLEGKVNLRLADETLLMDCLGVKKGCVGPLAILHNIAVAAADEAKKVTLVLDERLFGTDIAKIHSHPLTNDVSTALLPSNLKLFVEKIGVDPTCITFEVKGASSSDGGKAPANRPPDKKEAKGGNKDKKQSQPSKNKDKKTAKKGDTLLALQWKKDENFPMWYSDVIVLSEMISYYDISGCYILRPWSYKIWEIIQNWFNGEIEKLGVENSYFPLFVSQDRLEKEKDHVEGFAPEVAWVTKSGDGDLAKPIAVRPTSETIMYPAFSDWIKSHRDLPLKLNQWSNVVRWEFKDPTPFLRSREFLWQEGHTAHVSYEDADKMVMQALELYRKVYEELLAVPVVPGYKTEKEKFAGGHQTTTVEAYIAGSGRAIQGATSHNLGQNFGKMFDISFQDEQGKSQIAWQTSWGLTTRSIGVMIMVHGDDAGLVLPPRISPLQAVIVPIISKKLTMEDAESYCGSILKDLVDSGIRAKYDDRKMYNPGWKYNHWEQKGVPIRIEVGPRDIEQKMARVVVRFNGEKTDLPIEGLGAALKDKLETIQSQMFEKAKSARNEHLVQITEWKDFVPNLEKNNLVLTPWCGGENQDWEDWVKNKSREESLQARGEEGEDERTATSVAAKTLCIPFTQPDLPDGTKCIASGLPAKCW
eukprot:CAMPEP_0184864196 /NCGR_PEP_ID=MMETSP0580-20130426/14077_1 /TAXON_ID=1118495 /ORGANISM="Dactyliosolen fragilissimus" /LENGTH=1029 /DNA_ID=CAMNT_0027362881 /DNA_START=9 /DNA_END=3095 /DNA_ORIENTATION=+